MTDTGYHRPAGDPIPAGADTGGSEPRYSWIVRDSDEQPWTLLGYRWTSRRDAIDGEEHWFGHHEQVKTVEVIGEGWRDVEPHPRLKAFLHARVDEQTPDRPDLVAKYHRLVDEHLARHTCEDDGNRYAAGRRCPWTIDFVSMWRDHADFNWAWIRP